MKTSLPRPAPGLIAAKADSFRMAIEPDIRLETLGLIAGNRSLPLIFARQARRMGVRRLVAVAIEGETNPELASLVDDLVWIKVGQLTRLIKAFAERGVTRCVMLGQVAPRNLFDLRPDWRALALLLRLKVNNAHSIFGAIADELAGSGIVLVPAVPWLRAFMPSEGFRLGPKLSNAQRQDVQFGFTIAKGVARLEIGQTVVVKKGAVLAVEGFEGTDACLSRGGELAGKSGGAVAIKVAKENHDFRFDIPCIGPHTLQTCATAKIAVLAFEAGQTLLLEQEPVEQLARRHKISITTVGPQEAEIPA
ncbi:MAG: UDP-2,3-diacylglucosamine diphosphatase LpxI [Candidatus Omnitrophica bacterium]|nr:UDP-2,3-diacylglucosamine diphosphatase LpxI [Candidatus Omnitrophota bacterium]